MNPIYNTAIFAYKQAVNIASIRNEKAKLMRQGHKDVFNTLTQKIDKGESYIWIHASSLGEFEQGRPIIEQIKAKNPNQKILLTFFSPSGYEVRKNYPLVDIVTYLPFDLPSNVTKFLDIVNPKMAIFIKYEFWGNYITNLHKRGIPIYIVSAIFRPTQSFFKPWGGMFRKMLTSYKHLFVQDEASKSLLKTVGITNVTVTGDTRFDRVMDIASKSVDMPLFEKFKGGALTIIVGSSWGKDEEIVIDYFNANKDIKLIIAPHEIDVEHINSIMQRIKRPALLYSESEGKDSTVYDAIVIDSFGLLSSIYRYGEIAYIGGGFGVGIHNVPEAAVYGVPVIFGPNYKKFKEANELIALEGAFAIADAEEFNTIITKLRNEKTRKACGDNAGGYIQSNKGATQRVINKLPL